MLRDKSRTIADHGKIPLYFYADLCGLRHLADCHSDHNDLLVRRLLAFQNHISTHHLVFERAEWFNDWMLTTPQLVLYIIIRFGHLALLRHYLDGYPVQVAEEDNPLVFAALHSDIPRFQLLLEKGLDVHLEGPICDHSRVRKVSPLIAAARNQTPEYQEQLVHLLLGKGCIAPRDAIRAVLLCDMGAPCKPTIIRIFLEHGADAQLLATGRRSCLHLLLEIDNLSMPLDDRFEIALMLVAAGCDPTAPDDLGRSPFHLAIQTLSMKLVQWLIQKGFQLPSDAISSPLLWIPGHTKRLLCMLELLIAHNAVFEMQDARGRNALHFFSSNVGDFDEESTEKVLRLLIEHGCDINCRNDAGETPLHLTAAFPTFLHVLDLFLAHGAKLPADIVNYVARNFRSLGHECTIAILTTLVENFGASCRSHTQVRGDNALHCLLKYNKGADTEEILTVVSFLVENGCDVHARNSSGDTPLQVAVENGHLSVVRGVLTQITRPYVYADHLKLYPGDTNMNAILHRLCQCDSLWDGQFKDKVKLLQEAGYDFTRDINRPNRKGFTPLCIALLLANDPAIIPCLLDLGASFNHVNYVYMERLEWASNLPWYRDATDAHGRYLSRSKTTPDRVILVYHLLQVAHQGRLSSAITKSILDMAEYWACKTVIRKNVRHTAAYDSEPIVIPMVPGNPECERWTPRRLIFSCKAGFFSPREYILLTVFNN